MNTSHSNTHHLVCSHSDTALAQPHTKEKVVTTFAPRHEHVLVDEVKLHAFITPVSHEDKVCHFQTSAALPSRNTCECPSIRDRVGPTGSL